MRRLALLALLPALACGPAAPEPMLPTPATASASASAPPAPPPPSGPDPTVSDADPITGALSVDAQKRMCDEHLAAAQELVDRIKALKDAPPEKLTYEATLGRMDQVSLQIAEAGQLPYLMGLAHPDPAVRETAKACEPKTEQFNTKLYLDADLAAVLRAYAAKKEPLAPNQQRLLDEALRDFRRNGLTLPPDKQARLRKLNEEIVKLGQDFEANIAGSRGHIEIQPRQLAGLPKDYVKKHPPNEQHRIVIGTDPPDYFDFITYADDRKAALELYIAFTNRGGEDNVQILERLLALREEKAKLLGYATWADYAVEPRMAKSAKAVRDFLAEVLVAVKEPARAEFAQLMSQHKAKGGKLTDKLPPPDRYYLSQQVKKLRYKFDATKLRPYFEVTSVTKGLLDVAAQMYGLEFRKVEANAWHADVTAYEVWSEGKRIAKFYLDLYSRPDKYKHYAMFPLRTSAKLPDGRYLMPIAALECNFAKPGAEPGLMNHEDVVTFFHEFGHVLHHLLSKQELATYAGTNTVRDFVEAPSQMFEEWAWSRDVLDRFARHVETKERIPDELFRGMREARGFGRALDTQRQVFLARLDQELHTRPTPIDSTAVVQQVQEGSDSFAYVKGTHFQSSFGHLIGYDAGYYSYQWALALSRDVLTRFRKDGLLNPATAKAWRDEVLAKGGGTDERAMVKAFLGREPSNEAYFSFIKGKE